VRGRSKKRRFLPGPDIWIEKLHPQHVEQILGMPPMNQMDLAGSPMRDAFTDTPDPSPYAVVANTVPLDEMNPGSIALRGLPKAWALASAEMFAKPSFLPDRQDENLLNRAI
jgi:hypothetical protein